MKIPNIPLIILEILATALFSLFGTFIFSLLSFMSVLFLQFEGEGGPADGLAFFVVVFSIIPVWLVLVIIGPLIAKHVFSDEDDFMKRLIFSNL